uniref:Ribonuclease H-like domain-containing protein n=1 Tax=Tanacetum cinerariifolium TaxID=118510 RepID=A0A699HSH1_TANCI|nr:ribonuclease H-like domain-containing protein [Tanacetum cinerariifolium]
MKIEHYLHNTDYPTWEVIQKGIGPVQVSTDTNGQIRVLPPKTAEEILARERERKARTTLLMAIPEDHLVKFHKMTDAKEMWERDYTKVMTGFKVFRVNLRLMVQASLLKIPVRSFLGLYILPGPNGSQLNHEDLKQVDEFDLEKMDLKWQDEHKAMVTIDGKGIDWTGHAKDKTEDYALMAFNSSNSGSDTESTTSESDAKTSDLDSCDSSSSEETLETVPKPVESKPKVVNEPKVWYDAHIIEEYESDSDDEYMSKASVEQETPSFAFVNIVEHVKTPRQTAKEQNTCSRFPKPRKRDWNGLMSEKLGLGYGFTKNACFVCGSFSHLIKDCDFYEKRMAKQVELNKGKGKSTGPREHRPVWNNVQRLNHQNKFVSTSVLTKTGRFLVNAVRQNFSSQATSTSTARKVNTARPIDNPHQTLKGKGIVDSGCSRHMTGSKAYIVDYQDFNGVLVAFRGSKGQITSKGKIKTGKLDFKDVCFVKELQHFNLFSVSRMCDKKNKVLFIDTECLVLSHDFKLPDENQVLLRVPRQHNMYSFNLENIVASGGLACLIAKPQLMNLPNSTGGKFKEKSDEGFLVGYSLSSKAFRPITSENKANKTAGPKEINNSAGTQDSFDAGTSEMKADHAQEYYVLPLWSSYTLTIKRSKAKNGDAKLNEDTNSKINEEQVDHENQAFLEELERLKRQEKEANAAAETLRKKFA